VEKKIEEKIELYCQMYLKALEKLLRVNSQEGQIQGALLVVGEIAKDLRSEMIFQKRKEGQRNKESEGRLSENNEKLASEKQKEALQKFGVRLVPENLSMREASKILNKLINLSKESETALEKAVDELNRNWGGT
jgi:hypothetical protein